MERQVRDAYDARRFLTDKAFASACYAPFVSMFFTTDGNVLACCKNGSFPIGNVQRESLLDIWRGERAQEIREALRNYQFNRDCAYCEWEIGDGNRTSATPFGFDAFPVSSPTPAWPRQIEFEGSNTCNFECIMCN